MAPATVYSSRIRNAQLTKNKYPRSRRFQGAGRVGFSRKTPPWSCHEEVIPCCCVSLLFSLCVQIFHDANGDVDESLGSSTQDARSRAWRFAELQRIYISFRTRGADVAVIPFYFVASFLLKVVQITFFSLCRVFFFLACLWPRGGAIELFTPEPAR